MLFSTNTTIAVDREGVGLDRGIEMLLDAGFPALDLSFFKYRYFVMEDGYKETAKRIRSLAESRGAFFNQAHAPFGRYDTYVAEMVPDMPRIIEFAGLVGAKNLVVHPLIARRHYGYEREHFEMNMEFYSSLAPYAKNAGVKIAIENMWTTHPVTGVIVDSVCADPAELANYYDSLGDPDAFTVCLDLGHVALCGREPEDAIRVIGGDRLGAIHAHDVDYRSDLHTLPGQSRLNWDAICRALAEVGYSGEFTLESDNFPVRYGVEHLPTAFRFMADTARYYANLVDSYRAK